MPRRRVADVLLLAAVVLLVLGNVRGGPVDRVLRALTLDQAWDVFAPEPVAAHAELEAVVTFADGTEELWRPPRAGAALAVRSYHWEMWSRVVVLGSSPLAEATARWIGEQRTRPGRRPVRITLRRRWHPLGRPGEPRPRLWQEADFHVTETGR